MIQHTINTPYLVGPVHIYYFEIKGKKILIDTGPPTFEAKIYLKNNIPINELDYLFITHCHLDHYGLSDYINEQNNGKLVISKYDEMKFKNLEIQLDMMLKLFSAYGFSNEFNERLSNAVIQMNKMAPVNSKYYRLEEITSELDDLGISFLRCPGHSQSDIIYLIDNYAVTGDVLLRDIFQTPLLELDFDDYSKRFCNYKYYCETIVKLKQINGYKVMPGHRKDIDSIDERVSTYIKKLINRSKIIKEELQYKTIAEIALNFINEPEKNPINVYLKTSEIVFIKDFIENKELLINSLKQTCIYENLKFDLDNL